MTTTNTTNAAANTAAATPAPTFDFWGSILTGLKASMPYVAVASLAGAVGYVVGQRQQTSTPPSGVEGV